MKLIFCILLVSFISQAFASLSLQHTGETVISSAVVAESLAFDNTLLPPCTSELQGSFRKGSDSTVTCFEGKWQKVGQRDPSPIWFEQTTTNRSSAEAGVRAWTFDISQTAPNGCGGFICVDSSTLVIPLDGVYSASVSYTSEHAASTVCSAYILVDGVIPSRPQAQAPGFGYEEIHTGSVLLTLLKGQALSVTTSCTADADSISSVRLSIQMLSTNELHSVTASSFAIDGTVCGSRAMPNEAVADEYGILNDNLVLGSNGVFTISSTGLYLINVRSTSPPSSSRYLTQFCLDGAIPYNGEYLELFDYGPRPGGDRTMGVTYPIYLNKGQTIGLGWAQGSTTTITFSFVKMADTFDATSSFYYASVFGSSSITGHVARFYASLKTDKSYVVPQDGVYALYVFTGISASYPGNVDLTVTPLAGDSYSISIVKSECSFTHSCEFGSTMTLNLNKGDRIYNTFPAHISHIMPSIVRLPIF